MGIFLKKSLLAFLLALIISVPVFTKFVPNSNAQWYNQSFDEFYGIVYDSNVDDSELFGERYAAAQVNWVMWSLLAFGLNAMGRIGGGDSQAFSQCVAGMMNNPIGNLGTILELINSFPQCGVWIASIVANAINPIGLENVNDSSLVATVFSNRPISSVVYFRDIANRLNPVTEVSAQSNGFGFQSATLALELWKVSRNISYTLLIFVIVIMAFMIMFRYKISPQVVITVQSALPKLVITLILITFSYAIAGLMIDLMYVVIGLLAAILISSGLSTMDWADLFAELTYTQSVFGLMVKYFASFTIASLWAFFSTPWFILTGIFGVIVWIVTFILVIIVGIRIVLAITKTFVMIIFNIAFAPFQILGGAVGGGGFGAWIKNMAALLAVYPVIGFLFVISFIFIRAGGDINSIAGSDDLWPFDVSGTVFANNNWRPPFTGGDMDIIWMLASLAVLMMIPKVPDMIKGAMAGKGFGGVDLGEARTAGQMFSSFEQNRMKAAGDDPKIAHRAAHAVGGIMRAASGGTIK